MKALLNTVFALCISYLSFGQCYESSFFGYFESIKQVYEKRLDSLPYQYALTHYFNHLPEQCTKAECTSIPDYYFILAKSEFLYIQGKYADAILLLDSLLYDAEFTNKINFDNYAQALLLKIKIHLKFGNSNAAGMILSKLDSLQLTNSKNVTNTLDFKIRNAKADFLLKTNCYIHVESTLSPVIQNDRPSCKEDSLLYIRALTLVGEYYMDLNNEDSAIYYFNKSNSLLRRHYHEQHREFISLYVQLGDYHKHNGQYSESEIFYQKAEQIFIKKIGKEHPDFANIKRLFANLYRRIGRFDLADQNYTEALSVLKKIGFENTASQAVTMTSQAIMYTSIGKRKEAETHLLSAQHIMQNNNDTLELEYAILLQTLANLYYNQLKLDEAETLFIRTSKIRKTIQGDMHPDYAECLNGLGNIYQKRENYSMAESYYANAIQIITKPKSENTLSCPHFYNNLALLYLKTGQFVKSESLFLEIKKIYEIKLSKVNRTYLTLLDNISELYAKMNNQFEATKYFIEASKLRKRLISDSFKYLSANEVEGYMQRFRRGITNFNNYLITIKDPSGSLLIEAFENEIFYKGFLLNYHLELNNLIERKPILAQLNDSIKTIYKSIAYEHAKPIPSTSCIDSLDQIANKLEKELSRKSEDYETLTKRIRLKDLVKTLKTKQVIVEIMYLNQKVGPGIDSVYYAALIISNNNPTPIFIKLCSEEELLNAFPKTTKLNADYVNSLYNLNSRGLTPIEKNKRSLYELIWKKLEPHLKNIQTVFYIPAGLLHNINIQAIQVSKNHIAGTGRDIIQLTSSRQLLNNTRKESSFHSALLMGGIQYDETKQQSEYEGKPEAKSRGLNLDSASGSGKNYWPELNHSFREIYHLKDLLQRNNINVNYFSGAGASEEMFKSSIAKKNSIIHIATHGYFFPESTKTSERNQIEYNCPFMHSTNPMIRSGLILAHGNYGWNQCKPLPGRSEDGILTAFEISQMNLHKTKLAVLSACETGLGDIKGPEGVFGLQRAFKIAGVKYIVMSLWQIPDSQTEELMVQFYTNMLKHKMEIPTAFKNAQMQMRTKYNDPYFWAGFVLVQ